MLKTPRRAWITALAVGTAAALVVALVAATGGSSDDDRADIAASSSLDSTTTTEADAETTTTSPSAATSTSATTVSPGGLPPCEPDMGSTLLEEYVTFPPTGPEEPADWPGPPPQDGFDWNQDSNPDTLVIGYSDDTITIDWGAGQLVITGVRTNFLEPVADEDGTEFYIAGRGAEEIARQHRPAAVADVTGDGWLDLIVTNRGTAAVLAGSGDRTVTGDLAFDRVAIDTPGWRSPPVRGPQVYDGQGDPAAEPILVPVPTGHVVPSWDIDGVGAAGFWVTAIRQRVTGPFVYYEGIPCTTEG